MCAITSAGMPPPKTTIASERPDHRDAPAAAALAGVQLLARALRAAAEGEEQHRQAEDDEPEHECGRGDHAAHPIA